MYFSPLTGPTMSIGRIFDTKKVLAYENIEFLICHLSTRVSFEIVNIKSLIKLE